MLTNMAVRQMFIVVRVRFSSLCDTGFQSQQHAHRSNSSSSKRCCRLLIFLAALPEAEGRDLDAQQQQQQQQEVELAQSRGRLATR